MGFGKDSLDSEQFVVEISKQDNPSIISLRKVVDEIVQREKQILSINELLMLNPIRSSEYNQVKNALARRLELLYREIDKIEDIRIY